MIRLTKGLFLICFAFFLLGNSHVLYSGVPFSQEVAQSSKARLAEATFYFEKRQYEKSIVSLDRILADTIDAIFAEPAEINYLYYRNYKSLNRYDSALRYLEKMYNTQLLVLREETALNIQNINRFYQQEIDEEKIIEQDLELALDKKDRRVLIGILYLVIFLTSGLGVFLFFLLKSHQKYREQLLRTEQINDELKMNIGQKDILFHEMQHRVKNNLTMLISLLEMQQEGIKSKEAKGSYSKAIDRIQSMAIIYDNTYKKLEKSELILEDYLWKLARHLQSIKGMEVNFKIACDKLKLTPSRGIKFGLMINELMMNSFQHGLRSDEILEIVITGKEVGDNIEIEFQDNGNGIEDIDKAMALDKIGFFIMNSMIKQLNGSLNYKMSNVAFFSLSFPKQNKR